MTRNDIIEWVEREFSCSIGTPNAYTRGPGDGELYHSYSFRGSSIVACFYRLLAIFADIKGRVSIGAAPRLWWRHQDKILIECSHKNPCNPRAEYTVYTRFWVPGMERHYS